LNDSVSKIPLRQESEAFAGGGLVALPKLREAGLHTGGAQQSIGARKGPVNQG
jgi:hypothetical protein